MTGYLSKLTLRSAEQPQPIRPRLASLFEPVAGLPILSLKTTSVTTENETQDASPPTAEPVATTAEIKSSDNSRKLAAATFETPKAPSVDRGRGRTSSQELSRRPAPVPADKLVTKPTRVETVSASEESPATTRPLRNIAAVKQDPAILDQPRPETQVAHLIETKLIESLVRSEPPPTSTRETRKARPEPERHSVIVKPEVTAGSIQTPGKEADLGEASSSIRITIGRVDVRAIMPAAPPQPAVTSSSQRKGQPALSLDEYLKQRNGELS